MDYDQILEELGQFSNWHCLQCCLLFLFPMTGSFASLSFIFSGLEPAQFRCLVPECNEDAKTATVKDFGLDIFWHNDDGNIDYCRRYPTTNDAEIVDGQCISSSFNTSKLIEKDSLSLCGPSVDENVVIYENFGMDSTAVTRFNLICEDQYKVALTGSIYMCAFSVGSYLFGWLSDYLGRKKALTIAALVNASGLLMTAFMPNYALFTTARFITGLGGIGVFVVPFNLCVELVGNEYKTQVGILFNAPYAIGTILLGLIAIGIRDYQIYQIVICIPVFLLVGLYFIIPESPRWLIAKKRYPEAAKLIKNAAKFNKMEISPHLVIIPDEDTNVNLKVESCSTNDAITRIRKEKEEGMIDIFRHPECMKNTLVMSFAWIATNLGYFGLGLSASELSDNVYLSVILLGLVDLPALVVLWFMDHWGRKLTLVLSFSLCGICCIAAGYCAGTVKLVFALIGKCGIAGCFYIIYNYTVEMYPTVVRTTGLGICSMVGRFGGIAAPMVAFYLQLITFQEFSLIIFGATTFVAAVLSLLLPETLGAPLIESLDELQLIRKYSKPLLSWWSTDQANENVERISFLRRKTPLLP